MNAADLSGPNFGGNSIESPFARYTRIWWQVPVEWQLAAGGWPAPANPGPGTAGVGTDTAMFTLDLDGRVISWGAAAEQLSVNTASSALGRHICDVLAHAGQEAAIVRDVLARVASGHTCASVLPAGRADGSVEKLSFRWEPATGAGGRPEAFVIAERAGAHGQRLLSEAGTRIGTTLPLAHTAGEVVALTVPGFADAASVYLPERLLVADEFAWHAEGEPVPMRRLAARLGGLSEQASESIFPSGEVVVFKPDTP